MHCYADENTPANGQRTASKLPGKTPAAKRLCPDTSKTSASVKSSRGDHVDNSVDDDFCTGQKVASKRKRDEQIQAAEQAIDDCQEMMSSTLAGEGKMDREVSKENAVLLMESQARIFKEVSYDCSAVSVTTLCRS